eukprot:4907-Amphidinium_carterae.1
MYVLGSSRDALGGVPDKIACSPMLPMPTISAQTALPQCKTLADNACPSATCLYQTRANRKDASGLGCTGTSKQSDSKPCSAQ